MFCSKGTIEMRNFKFTLQSKNTKKFNSVIRLHQVFKPRNWEVLEIKVLVKENYHIGILG